MSGATTPLPRAIEHPSVRVPVLSWWRGVYDHVFVAPHPFYRLSVTGTSSLGGAPDCEDIEDGIGHPRGMRSAIKAGAESIPWAAIHEAVAPEESRERVYRAIWLLSCLGVTERAGIALQRRIREHCLQNRICLPLDDSMPPNLEPPIGRFLACLGVTSVTALDEFGDNVLDVPLAAFQADQPPLSIPDGRTGSGVYGLHVPEVGVLLTWSFDCAEALIAMTEPARARAKPESHFEGWYADQTTYSDVINPREFFPPDE